MLSWLSQWDIVNMKYMYINNHHDNADNSHEVIRWILGSSRKPARWHPIYIVECCYELHGLYLGIQSWIHTHLCDRIRMNRRLKRVKRSHLPKLCSAHVSKWLY